MNGDTSSGLDLGVTIRGFAPGQVVFDRYRLDRILGRGGMGVVWLAHDQELGEDIALKFLPEAVRLDALALEELKRETRKSRKLTHRHIVRVYNFVSDAHSAGISMEWIDGSTLSALRLGRPHRVFDPAELSPWVKQVCEALEYAHGVAKLIHRDLKAANIMVTGAGEAKVTDFGISSSLTESASRVSAQRTSSGTLAYMSPQQALGERPKVADDIYSLGATLYELIAGKPPFFRGDLYVQIRDVVPPSMAERRADSEIPADGIPDPWEKAVAACLEKDPARRPQSAMEVAWMLGLVKEFERKEPVEITKPEIIRVPKEEFKTARPEPGGDTAARITGSLTALLPTRQTERIEEFRKKFSTSLGRFFAAPELRGGATSGPATAGAMTPPEKGPRKLAGLAAGALVFVLVAVAIWHFSRPHPAPIAENSTPAPSATAAPTVTPAPTATAAPTATPAPTVTPVPTVTPAPTVTPGPSAAPAESATPATMPEASAVAVIENPSPGIEQPVMAPSAAPSISGTEAAVDKELVGRWQTGSARSRTRLDLGADGKYFLTVSGTVTDYGTMSGSDGAIEEFSKNNPEPAEVTYVLNDGKLDTKGKGPFDGAVWRKISAAPHQVRKSEGSEHSSNGSGSGSGSGSGIGQKIKSGMSKIKHLF